MYIVRKNGRKLKSFKDRHEALNWARKRIRKTPEWQSLPFYIKLENPRPSEFNYTIRKAA